MRSWIAGIGFSVALTMGVAVEARAQADWPEAALTGDCELTRVLDGAGLSGSAPLVGEPRFADRADAIAASHQAERDFAAVLADLGLSGSAPLVGVRASGQSAARVEAPAARVTRAGSSNRRGNAAIVKDAKSPAARLGRVR